MRESSFESLVGLFGQFADSPTGNQLTIQNALAIMLASLALLGLGLLDLPLPRASYPARKTRAAAERLLVSTIRTNPEER